MQFGATQLFDVRAKLCDVNVPALILCGDSDNVMPLGQSQSLKKLIPKSDLRVYEGAGHLLLVEAPEAFVQDVATFLGDKFNWDQNHS